MTEPFILSPEALEHLGQVCLKIDREKKERERMTTPRDQWTAAQHHEDALARLEPAHKRALDAREALRDELAALDAPKARRILTDAGREEQRQKALAKSHAVLDEVRQALALVDGMLDRRDALAGRARVFQEARLVPVDPDDPLKSELVEEMKRARLWTQLMTAPPDELKETIQTAAHSHNYALVHLAG
jgi:hypothetical protein